MVTTTAPDQYASLAAQNVKAVQRDLNVVPVGQDLNLVIACNVLTKKSEVIQNLSQSVKPGGFILLEETGKVDLNLLKTSNLICVAKQVIPGKSYLLFKKKENKLEQIIVQLTEKNFHWVEDVKTALQTAATNNQEVLFVNQGEELFGNCFLQNLTQLLSKQLL